MLTYELWDLDVGNLLERFTSEAAMLRAVREYLELEGEAYLDVLGVRPVWNEGGQQVWLPRINGQALRAKLKAVPTATAVQIVNGTIHITCNDQGRLISGVSQKQHLSRCLQALQARRGAAHHGAKYTLPLTPRDAVRVAQLREAV